VFIWSGGKRKVLDASLGFASGVMLAASYWCLLAPAIEMAEESGVYSSFAFVPVSIGFVAGAAFVYLADILLSYLGMNTSNMSVIISNIDKEDSSETSVLSKSESKEPLDSSQSTVRPRLRRTSSGEAQYSPEQVVQMEKVKGTSWKRILLLIIAITVHNIPEGLAVGVGFGAIGRSSSATFENARNLAIGIGIQNFPEGLAVSLPLRGAGMSVWKSFWYCVCITGNRIMPTDVYCGHHFTHAGMDN
jgi:zinc transporter 11